MRQRKLDSNKHSVFLLYYQPPTDKICAIDLGLKNFVVIVDSEGNIQKISHPKWITKMEKRIELAKSHEKLRNHIEDFLHKLSKAIISENQAVVVEGLNVKGLLCNGNLSKYIADSSWSKFLQFLYYKAQF